MMKYFAMLIVGSTVLAGCGEKAQTMTTPKSETTAYSGTGSNFTAPGWKPGDKTSWEQGLKARLQNTQNDYSMSK